jgi:hypothetical protein
MIIIWFVTIAVLLLLFIFPNLTWYYKPDKLTPKQNTLKPRPNTPKPKPNTPKPKPNTPKPKPNTPKPKPKPNTPKPNTPKPKPNTPKPNTPKPKPNTPKPKPNTPKPKPNTLKPTPKQANNIFLDAKNKKQCSSQNGVWLNSVSSCVSQSAKLSAKNSKICSSQNGIWIDKTCLSSSTIPSDAKRLGVSQIPSISIKDENGKLRPVTLNRLDSMVKNTLSEFSKLFKLDIPVNVRILDENVFDQLYATLTSSSDKVKRAAAFVDNGIVYIPRDALSRPDFELVFKHELFHVFQNKPVKNEYSNGLPERYKIPYPPPSSQYVLDMYSKQKRDLDTLNSKYKNGKLPPNSEYKEAIDKGFLIYQNGKWVAGEEIYFPTKSRINGLNWVKEASATLATSTEYREKCKLYPSTANCALVNEQRRLCIDNNDVYRCGSKNKIRRTPEEMYKYMENVPILNYTLGSNFLEYLNNKYPNSFKNLFEKTYREDLLNVFQPFVDVYGKQPNELWIEFVEDIKTGKYNQDTGVYQNQSHQDFRNL